MELDKPIILEEKIYRILGCVYYGNPFHTYKGWDTRNEIGNTWKRFEALDKKYWNFLEKIKTGDAYGYEVHIEPVDYCGITVTNSPCTGLNGEVCNKDNLDYYYKESLMSYK